MTIYSKQITYFQEGSWTIGVRSFAWHPSLPEPAKGTRSRFSTALQGVVITLGLIILTCTGR